MYYLNVSVLPITFVFYIDEYAFKSCFKVQVNLTMKLLVILCLALCNKARDITYSCSESFGKQNVSRIFISMKNTERYINCVWSVGTNKYLIHMGEGWNLYCYISSLYISL